MINPYAIGGAALGVIAWTAGVAFASHNAGKNSVLVDVAEQVETAREQEHGRYLERQAITNAAYERALDIASSASASKPQIIREIRNAPPTECSNVPVGLERVRLFNLPIAVDRDEDPSAGGEIDRALAGFAAGS